MTKERYIALMNFWQAHPKLLTGSAAVQKSFELAIYIICPLFALWLIIKGDIFWFYSMLDCGLGFIGVTLLRKFLNKPRPYEKYAVSPAVKKETMGNSFPSRHAFSAAIIAVNIFAVLPVLGSVVMFMAVTICVLRVLLGFHFIRDVVSGFLIGIIIGSFVFFA